jgi:hypothetical protein
MVKSGADFSTDRRYRYRLYRIWDETKPAAVFVMLNPSTADEIENDPTIERCQQRAMMMGYGGIVAVNIFAWRSTDPKKLYGLPDPVGPDNDRYIREAAMDAGVVVCGWGKHGNLFNRGLDVLCLLREAGVTPHALKVNGDGTPAHPLYLSYKLLPTPMK